MHEGTLALDLHGKNIYQATVALDAALRRAGGAYRIRVVHGYRGGTALRDMLEQEYAHHPRVVRLARVGDGVTELVLREL